MSQRLAESGGRRRFLSTIAGKITLRMLLVAAIPVLAVGAWTIGSLLALADRTDDRLASNRSELTEQTIGANRAEQAGLVLSRMSAFVDERISDTIDWSRAAPIVEAAGADYPELEPLVGRPPGAADSLFEADHLLDASGRSNRWLRTQTVDQPAFVDALITDASGFTVGASGDTDDFTNADQPWYGEAWDEGVYLGPVEVDDGSDTVTFDVAVRIHDPTSRRPLGVLKAVVDVAALQVFADELSDESAGVGVRVLTSAGLLLAETDSGHDPGRISTELPFDEVQGQAYADVLAGGDQSGAVILDETVGGFSKNEPVKTVPRLGVDVANHDWVAFVEQPASTALEPLDGLESLSSDLNSTARVLIFVVAGLVVAAMGLAFLLARLLATRIARPINQLRIEANRLADRELPELVSSLNAPDVTGEIPVVTPIRIDADGEVAELASAFNSVRSTAVELAAAEAIGRTKDVSSILLNLGRRNQQLVGRQVRFIDDLERSESDPDSLRNLFLLDQMATRMRRNAESLLVLAGEDSPRRVSHPRPIEEVVRAATGEVEDYARVRLASTDPVLVQPNVVNDVTHLLAELIENATNFSPPDELIEIVGVREPDGGYTVSIIDRGVGMGPAKLRDTNDRIRDPIFAGNTASSFLGLYVVGRLAARHDIDARLVESTPSGVTAIVTLPRSCVADIPQPVGEMTASRLSQAEPVGDVPASWPAPAVTHPRPSRGDHVRPAATTDSPEPSTPASADHGTEAASAEPGDGAQAAAATIDTAEPAGIAAAATIDTPDTAGIPGPDELSGTASDTTEVTAEVTADPTGIADTAEVTSVPGEGGLTEATATEATTDVIEATTEVAAGAFETGGPEVTEDAADTGAEVAAGAFETDGPEVTEDAADTGAEVAAGALVIGAAEVMADAEATTDVTDHPAEDSGDTADTEATTEVAAGPLETGVAEVMADTADTPGDTADEPETGEAQPSLTDGETGHLTPGDDVGRETPAFDPATTADLPALTVAPIDEDQTAGRPIPPFRARESKVPAGAPDPGDGPSTGLDQDRFRVRKRVRHGDGSVDAVLEPVPVAGDDEPAEVRAAEVRDKLNRFASGVRAAKDRVGPVAANNDPDEDPEDGVEDDSEARRE